jgi:hypothetical protein
MASEEDVPPVIKMIFFIAAMIRYAVAGSEAGKTGDVSFGLYILNNGPIVTKAWFRKQVHNIRMQIIE